MGKFIIIVSFCISIISVYGQNPVDSLVERGIDLHDRGKYKEAIDTYLQALTFDSESPLVNYEVAMSYFYVKDYENALKYSSKVIKTNNGPLLDAYNVKAASLDNLGRTEESIEIYQEALKLFGNNYLLHYNLGLNYYKLDDYGNASIAFTNAINCNPEHASSHFFLGLTMQEKGKRVKSLLCLYYFLFLEPDTERSHAAFASLQKQLGENAEQDTLKSGNTNIIIDPKKNYEFGQVELMLALLHANQMVEKKNKTDFENFEATTKSFFLMLGKTKNTKTKDLWEESYIPFFYNIAQSAHLETFCRYVSQLSMPESLEWLQENEDKFIQLNHWLENAEETRSSILTHSGTS